MKHGILLRLMLFSVLCFNTIYPADLIIFSYDRPMQLYALLESCEKYITGITSATVICRVSSPDYQIGYDLVQNRFPVVDFVRQQNPPHDFRILVEDAAFKKNKSNYVLFAVDDIIVKDFVDLQSCANLLEKHKVYCFLLRLSPHIDYCYMLDKTTPPPLLKKVEADVYKYCFKEGKGDWCYPNNVDMTLYRKQDIYHAIMSNAWTNPNQLEGSWASKSNLNQFGLIFDDSKIINIPMNLVNQSSNRAMHSHSTTELLKSFLIGEKIDISRFDRIKNNSAHIAYNINFISNSLI